MSNEPYNIDDLFSDSDVDHLKTEKPVSEQPCRQYTENPLVLVELEQISRDEEEIALKKENKEKRKYEQEETAYITKEIKEARAELRILYDYKELTPRQLCSMIRFYQEHALLGKTAGLLSDNHPNVLLMPMIENDGERDYVVLRPPILGALERHQILSNSEMIETVKDYYRLNHF